MASFEDLRRVALTLPGAYEDDHRGAPALRVNNRKFALDWAQVGRTILKLEPSHQTFLFEVRPEVFEPCKVGSVNWSFVDLKALDLEELEALVIEAWSTVVPRKVTRPLLGDGGAKA